MGTEADFWLCWGLDEVEVEGSSEAAPVDGTSAMAPLGSIVYTLYDGKMKGRGRI